MVSIARAPAICAGEFAGLARTSSYLSGSMPVRRPSRRARSSRSPPRRAERWPASARRGSPPRHWWARGGNCVYGKRELDPAEMVGVGIDISGADWPLRMGGSSPSATSPRPPRVCVIARRWSRNCFRPPIRSTIDPHPQRTLRVVGVLEAKGANMVGKTRTTSSSCPTHRSQAAAGVELRGIDVILVPRGRSTARAKLNSRSRNCCWSAPHPGRARRRLRGPD